MHLSLLNLFFSLLVSVLLVWSVYPRCQLLLKPSIIVLGFYHLCIQWPATLYGLFGVRLWVGTFQWLDFLFTDGLIPWGWHFFLLTQIFPTVGLIGSLLLFRETTDLVWERLSFTNGRVPMRVVLILGAAIAAIVGYYLSVVPFYRTGLYAILYEPGNLMMARENSLLLPKNKMLPYLFSWMAYSIVPMFSCLVFFICRDSWKNRRMWQVTVSLFFILAGIAAVSLIGAKWPPAKVILCICLAFMYWRKMRFSGSEILVAGFAILVIPIFILNIQGYPWYNSIWRITSRIFFEPMRAASDFIRYPMEFGFSGIAAYSKLARLLDVTPIELPLAVKFRFGGSAIGSAPASYVFHSYAAFGWSSIFFSWVELWALDCILCVYRRIRNPYILLVCVSVVSAACISMVSTDYTVTLVTNAVLITLAISFLLDMMCRKSAMV